MAKNKSKVRIAATKKLLTELRAKVNGLENIELPEALKYWRVNPQHLDMMKRHCGLALNAYMMDIERLWLEFVIDLGHEAENYTAVGFLERYKNGRDVNQVFYILLFFILLPPSYIVISPFFQKKLPEPPVLDGKLPQTDTTALTQMLDPVPSGSRHPEVTVHTPMTHNSISSGVTQRQEGGSASPQQPSPAVSETILGPPASAMTSAFQDPSTGATQNASVSNTNDADSPPLHSSRDMLQPASVTQKNGTESLPQRAPPEVSQVAPAFQENRAARPQHPGPEIPQSTPVSPENSTESLLTHSVPGFPQKIQVLYPEDFETQEARIRNLVDQRNKSDEYVIEVEEARLQAQRSAAISENKYITMEQMKAEKDRKFLDVNMKYKGAKAEVDQLNIKVNKLENEGLALREQIKWLRNMNSRLRTTNKYSYAAIDCYRGFISKNFPNSDWAELEQWSRRHILFENKNIDITNDGHFLPAEFPNIPLSPLRRRRSAAGAVKNAQKRKCSPASGASVSRKRKKVDPEWHSMHSPPPSGYIPPPEDVGFKAHGSNETSYQHSIQGPSESNVCSTSQNSTDDDVQTIEPLPRIHTRSQAKKSGKKSSVRVDIKKITNPPEIQDWLTDGQLPDMDVGGSGSGAGPPLSAMSPMSQSFDTDVQETGNKIDSSRGTENENQETLNEIAPSGSNGGPNINAQKIEEGSGFAADILNLWLQGIMEGCGAVENLWL